MTSILIKNQQNKWVDLSLLNLSVVALLGLILRSKVIFPLPKINYNYLLEAHSHFSFEGWATLILITLFVSELLPEPFGKRPIYQVFLAAIALLTWTMLISFSISGYSVVSAAILIIFVLITYALGLTLIKDICKANLSSSVTLLAVSSIVCLMLSSAGIFGMTYILFARSLDPAIYRNCMFTYLHFQYNGFFTLGVFALLFHFIHERVSPKTAKKIQLFSKALCISVLPSLFLSYLWQDLNIWFRIMAASGSLLLLICFCLFLLTAISLKPMYNAERPVIRFLLSVSLGAFMLKVFLQSFTVFPVIGNAIFGSRPVIMGFLHLVFLAFVTLFVLSYLTKKDLLNGKLKITNSGLIVFAIAIILNESILIAQGLSGIFMSGSYLFSWLLWITGILLFAGTLGIALSRIRSKQVL